MRVWTRRDFAAFLLTGLAAFSVYLHTLPASITLEDAGELVVAADTLGVPHPPGYPIWTFLAWFFQWILHGVTFRGYPNPAWAVSLSSALFGALACGGVAMGLCRFSRDVITSGLRPPRNALRDPAPSLIIGAAWGLIASLLLQHAPPLGTLAFSLTGLALLLLIPLQALTPPPHRYPFQAYLPTPAHFGAGLAGFAAACAAVFTAWSLLRVPALHHVFALALLALLLLALATLLLDRLLGKAARQPHLQPHFLRAGVDIIVGVGGGLLLAFSPLMWSQSVIPEVYSLNALFLSLLLLLTYAYIRDPRPPRLYLIAFIFGLGLTNHQSLLFLFFFLVAGVAAARKRQLLKDGLFWVGLGALGFLLAKAWQYHRAADADAAVYFLLRAIVPLLFLMVLTATRGGLFKTWRPLAALALLGTLGLAFHLYMPVASEQNPPMNWGNTRTPDGFIHSLTRGQYARFDVTKNLDTIRETMSTPIPDPQLREDKPHEFDRAHHRRTRFPRQLGAFFFSPHWKTSIANQFSWAFPREPHPPDAPEPPPPETLIPLALLGLLPLLVLYRLAPTPRHWIACTIVAMFFLTVVFLIIQWPDLSLNDLWVKRVQYVQAHVLYAYWMAFGGLLLLLALYALLPFKAVPLLSALTLFGLYIAFPLHKETHDPRHLAHLGASGHHGSDLGWQYGFHTLKGANGILLDELAHHTHPDAQWTDFARRYLRQQGIDTDLTDRLATASPPDALPFDEYHAQILAPLDLDPATQRTVREAVTLAAFRALPPHKQQKRLVHLHRPLPDWDYPPEFEPHAILFGGTDPGRFVNTYMVFSALCRPDIFVLTQNALAQTDYLAVMRDLYGDHIYIPDDADNQTAFEDYAHQLRLYDPDAFLRFISDSGRLAVSGFHEVMKINAGLSRIVFEKNRARHPIYLEESSPIPWMIPHLVPHGLVMKLSPDPRPLTPREIQQNMDYWEWQMEWLLETHKPPETRHHRFHRNLQARKSYSKLRLAQANLYFERGLRRQAKTAVRQALRLYPAGPETMQTAIDMLIQLREFDTAAGILADFARHDPANNLIPAYTQRLRRMRQLNRDLLDAEEKLANQPSGNLALELTVLYHRFGMTDRMESMADLVLTLPGLGPEFQQELAIIMRAFRHLPYYRKALKSWSERDPDDPRPHIDLAVIALAEKDYTAMYRHLTRAIRIDGNAAPQTILRDPRFLDLARDPTFLRFLGYDIE